jgi:hypothetical protein
VTSKIFVQSFTEDIEETQPLGYASAPWVAGPRPNNIDQQVNRWVMETGNRIVSIVPTTSIEGDSVRRNRHLVYAVTYEVLDEQQLPRPAGNAPCVAVTRIEGDEHSADFCMAGVFGVPEGAALALDDEEAAPIPVFSPDFNVGKYAAWFRTKESL